MPPKKNTGPSKKTVQKEKAKIIEDKTFGLKNKNKSKKVQQYVQQVEKRVAAVDKRAQEEAKRRKEEKKLEEERQREMQALFKPAVQQPKVPPGVDPKSFVCELFKLGQCTKGDRCKFSHDLSVARRAEKIDIYTDRRTASAENNNMDDWDQSELERVITLKHEEVNKNKPTKIVCKYFLDAVESHKYGWFWECPNGNTCQYVHALPPGFVLKKKGEVLKDPEEEEQETIEQQIEIERAKLKGGEQVTKQSFLLWKQNKERLRTEAAEKEKETRRNAIESGKVLMSGRELLVYNPDVFVDDDDSLVPSELVLDNEGYDTLQALSLQRELNAAALELGVAASEIVDPELLTKTPASTTTTTTTTTTTPTQVEADTPSSSTTTTATTSTNSPTSETTPVDTGALDESLFVDDEPPSS